MLVQGRLKDTLTRPCTQQHHCCCRSQCAVLQAGRSGPPESEASAHCPKKRIGLDWIQVCCNLSDKGDKHCLGLGMALCIEYQPESSLLCLGTEMLCNRAAWACVVYLQTQIVLVLSELCHALRAADGP